MVKYIKTKDGRTVKVDFYSCIWKEEDGYDKTEYYIDNVWHCTKVFYRPERTWDDHMGNTPCGYYVIAPLPNGERRRVYMF